MDQTAQVPSGDVVVQVLGLKARALLVSDGQSQLEVGVARLEQTGVEPMDIVRLVKVNVTRVLSRTVVVVLDLQVLKKGMPLLGNPLPLRKAEIPESAIGPEIPVNDETTTAEARPDGSELLTEAGVRRLFQPVTSPIQLQILQIAQLTGKTAARVSDGKDFVTALFSSLQLGLAPFSVLRLNDFFVSDIKGKPVVFITKSEVIHPGYGLTIGSPALWNGVVDASAAPSPPPSSSSSSSASAAAAAANSSLASSLAGMSTSPTFISPTKLQQAAELPARLPDRELEMQDDQNEFLDYNRKRKNASTAGKPIADRPGWTTGSGPTDWMKKLDKKDGAKAPGHAPINMLDAPVPPGSAPRMAPNVNAARPEKTAPAASPAVNLCTGELQLKQAPRSGQPLKVTLELKLVSADRIGVFVKPPEYSLTSVIALIKQVHGHLQLPESEGANAGIWTVPLNAHDALSSRFYSLGNSGVDITVKKLPPECVKQLTTASKAYTPPTVTTSVFDTENSIPDKLRGAMFPFQKEGVDYVISRGGRAMIGDEMGLGKTIQAIASVCYYRSEWPVLVLAPSSLRLNWREEFIRWVPWLTKLQVNVVLQGKTPIMPDRSTQVVITSYDLVHTKHKQIADVNFQVIICDESHYLKNPKAKRTASAIGFLHSAKRVIMLTGTPALSRPIELFTQIGALRPGLLGSHSAFGVRYCGARRGRFGMEYKGAQNTHELHLLLKQYCMVRRLKQEVLTQLPEKIRSAVMLETPSQACAKIQQQVATCKQAIQALLSDDIDRHESLSNTHKGLMAEAYQATGFAKLESVKDYITDLIQTDCKFLVFAHHKHVMDGIEEAVKKTDVDYFRLDGSTPAAQRQADVTRFQSQESCRVAILSITAGGTGITLTAASHVVFAELTWTPAQLLQAEDRVHRIGQANAVTITYLLGKGTLDDNMWPLLNSKLQVLTSVLDGASNGGLDVDNIEGDRESMMLRSTKVRQRPRRQIVQDDEEEEMMDLRPEPVEENPFLEKGSQWKCPSCTFDNLATAKTCEVCQYQRAVIAEDEDSDEEGPRAFSRIKKKYKNSGTLSQSDNKDVCSPLPSKGRRKSTGLLSWLSPSQRSPSS